MPDPVEEALKIAHTNAVTLGRIDERTQNIEALLKDHVEEDRTTHQDHEKRIRKVELLHVLVIGAGSILAFLASGSGAWALRLLQQLQD